MNNKNKFNLQIGSDFLLDVNEYVNYDTLGNFIIKQSNSFKKTPIHRSIFNENNLFEINDIISDRHSYAELIIIIPNNLFKHKDEDIGTYIVYNIKNNTPIQLRRHNIKRYFVIKKVEDVFFVKDSLNNNILLMRVSLLNDSNIQSDDFKELDHFIGDRGYVKEFSGLNKIYSEVNFLRNIENNKKDNLLLNFNVEFDKNLDNNLMSVRAYWEIKSVVKATRIRWRNIPSNKKIVRDIKFNIKVPGYYTKKPEIELINDMGRNPDVDIKLSEETHGNIVNIKVDDIGGGYLSAPLVKIHSDKFTEIYPGLIDSIIDLDTEGRINHIKVVNKGTGYTFANVIIKPLSLSNKASPAYGYAIIEKGFIKNIVLTEQGYGFTDGLEAQYEIEIEGDGENAILEPNIDILSQWTYETPQTLNKDIIIENLERGLNYEIQILCSIDECFRGEDLYSKSLFFTYY